MKVEIDRNRKTQFNNWKEYKKLNNFLNLNFIFINLWNTRNWKLQNIIFYYKNCTLLYRIIYKRIYCQAYFTWLFMYYFILIKRRMKYLIYNSKFIVLNYTKYDVFIWLLVIMVTDDRQSVNGKLSVAHQWWSWQWTC